MRKRKSLCCVRLVQTAVWMLRDGQKLFASVFSFSKLETRHDCFPVLRFS